MKGILIMTVFIAVLTGSLLWFLGRKVFLKRLKIQLFVIKMPILKRDGRDLKKDIASFEQLLNSLSSFRKPFIFEAVVPQIGDEIKFYAAVPWEMEETLVRQFYALWEGAKIERSEDYSVFNHGGVSVGAWIRAKQRFLLPIKTYAELETDSFSAILGGLAKVREVGEGAALQVVVLPVVSKNERKEITGAIQVMKKGWKLKDVMKTPTVPTAGDFVRDISPEDEKNKRPQDTIVDDIAVKALEIKASKPLFRVNVRIVASAPTLTEAEDILNGMGGGFSQFFEAPARNELVVVRPRDMRGLMHHFIFRNFEGSQGVILNGEEIASLFHLPTPFTEVPKIHMLKSKQAPPPPALPKEGTIIGESFYRNELKPVYITNDDRRRHLYIVGQTGTGKSTLITNMAGDDIKRGKGVAVIDPHGDLIHSLLCQIPKERFEDVILFNPAEVDRPLGLNMIEHDPSRPEERTFIVNEMVSIFDKLYDMRVTGGPMFEQYMRNALLLLMEDSPNEAATLMEVPRVFTDAEWRRAKLARIKNPTVADFWEKEAAKAGGEAALANITPYITSKFNNFTANDYMRVIIGQERSAFQFREVMDSGKILLVNLSKGLIGEINAKLLGMIIVGKILMAALGRADTQEETRRDFNLYIDEFQNFTTESIATILSEARKYRLNLVIANQFIGQLSDPIRKAVFGNVGSLVAFRVGVEDTDALVKQFEPIFDAHDLVNIDNFNAYAKLLIRGETSKPFNIKTLPGPSGDPRLVEVLRNLSRMKYGRDKAEVEDAIYRRLRS